MRCIQHTPSLFCLLPCVLVNLLACFMCLNASWLTFILAILTGGFWPACFFGACCFLALLPCFVQKVEKLLLKKDPWPLFRSSIGQKLIFVQLYHYCKKHIFPNIVQTTWVELKCAAGAGKHCIHVHIYICMILDLGSRSTAMDLEKGFREGPNYWKILVKMAEGRSRGGGGVPYIYIYLIREVQNQFWAIHKKFGECIIVF